MEKITINNFNSLPASFVEVSTDSKTDLYTRGKLKVFYVGETADHRLFTKEFSDKLIKTIAYTPVVSHYDEKSKEFVGHNNEQDIYGLVDPMVEPSFVKEGDTTWAICDVILYTKRPDKTGEIAKKIIGHAESLELNAETVKYKINRDFMGRFKNVEFTDGQFIGVSVLGKDQEPAFTGAGFFSEESLKNYCNLRGKEMNLNVEKFMDLSWGEKGKMISEALYAQYKENYGYIEACYDSYVIAYLYDPEAKAAYMYKITYALDGDKVTLGAEKTRVVATYTEYEKPAETQAEVKTETEVKADAEVTPTAEVKTEEVETKAEVTEAACGDKKKKQCADEGDAKKKKQCAEEEETAKKKQCAEEEEASKKKKCSAEVVANEPKIESKMESVKDDKEEQKQEQSNSSVLSEAEYKELAEYRKKDKITLINSYSDIVPADVISSMVADVDKYSKEDLVNKMNTLYVKYARTIVAAKETPMNTFAGAPEASASKEPDLAQYLRDKNI